MKYAQPNLAVPAAERIRQLETQNAKLIAEVARLEGERDAARKAARAWKRAAKGHRMQSNFLAYRLEELRANYAVLTMQTGAK